MGIFSAGKKITQKMVCVCILRGAITAKAIESQGNTKTFLMVIYLEVQPRAVLKVGILYGVVVLNIWWAWNN